MNAATGTTESTPTAAAAEGASGAAEFAVGSLVRARGREWVVLPQSTDELAVLRPLGGTDAETAGILTELEAVEAATFAPPTVEDRGDHRSARMLRDALRLGVRSSAGPFRSFGDIAVTPRPYQLVPLLMALKLDTVRLLIADDVGIGKTIEAGLIAKEMLTTGVAGGLAVLCPPHLAEQWQRELSEKFHLDAELVLASTAARLERDLPIGTSIFEAHRLTIVSMDFIKSDRHRDDFLRACPDLVIVDEAHTCADPAEGRGSRHQRHQLLEGLAADPDRHLVLVTATPHSGKVGAFRSLLALLDPGFGDLDEDITDTQRARLARHLVQRRRGDITEYLGDTPFPERERLEEAWALSPAYSQLFNDVLAFVRGTVRGQSVQQRVRWWSALALLRSLASSPAAAAATLTTRAANAEAADVDEADEIAQAMIFDADSEVDLQIDDSAPGALPINSGATDPATEDANGSPDPSTGDFAATLLGFAQRAEALRGGDDAKLTHLKKLVKRLIADGFAPIVFCRFIPTAEYVAAELRDHLPGTVTVEAVTGLVPPSEREDRVEALGDADKRVLVATDCLSEGINLQHSFTAVVHYDLPWNPTRLEQREGRVDRFGQVAATVRVATMVGRHVIDRIVEEVLIDKHLAIRKALGVSVPVPATSGEVLEALTDEILAAEDIEEQIDQQRLSAPGVFEDFDADWEADAERERASRTRFAQNTIGVDEVQAELVSARAALGDESTVGRFVADAVVAHGGVASQINGRQPASGGDAATLPGVTDGTATPRRAPALRLDLSETDLALRDRIPLEQSELDFTAGFTPPVPDGQRLLGRTDPIVSALAGYVLDTALDPLTDSAAARAGVIRTGVVDTRTHLVLVRLRYQLLERRRNRALTPMLAEEAAAFVFTGSPGDPTWLDDDPDSIATLLDAPVGSNVPTGMAQEFLTEALDALPSWSTELQRRAHTGAEALADAHMRVREQARMAGSIEVTPSLPVDVLGVYVMLPDPAGAQ